MKSAQPYMVLGITLGFILFLAFFTTTPIRDIVALMALGLLVMVCTRVVAWVKKRSTKPKVQLLSQPRNGRKSAQNMPIPWMVAFKVWFWYNQLALIIGYCLCLIGIYSTSVYSNYSADIQQTVQVISIIGFILLLALRGRSSEGPS